MTFLETCWREHKPLVSSFTNIMTDECCIQFNWDGVKDKLAFKDFPLFLQCLCDQWKLDTKTLQEEIIVIVEKKKKSCYNSRARQKRKCETKNSLKTPTSIVEDIVIKEEV